MRRDGKSDRVIERGRMIIQTSELAEKILEELRNHLGESWETRLVAVERVLNDFLIS